jgi:hypothetical protein
LVERQHGSGEFEVCKKNNRGSFGFVCRKKARQTSLRMTGYLMRTFKVRVWQGNRNRRQPQEKAES